MRPLGVSALILTVFSFLSWLVSWIYWTFFSLPLAYNVLFDYVARGLGFLSVLFQILALALVSIGLMIAAKKQPKI